jgi:hypothetical protein
MLEVDVTIDYPHVNSEIEDTEEPSVMILSTTLVEDEGRLSKLRQQLRTDHLNSEHSLSLIRLCEEYNYVFHLPGDKLTCTTAAEHAIPTPTIDPSRAINTKLYRIPEVHKEEVQKQVNKC